MNSEVKIYDNYLSDSEFQLIKTQLFNPNFPWYLGEIVDSDPDNDDVTDIYNFQMFHLFYENYSPTSVYSELLNPIITKLNPWALLRLKANLTFKTSKIFEQGYHTDFPDTEPCTTGVYYLNNTDGYTRFSSGEIIESIENRLVLFDSRLSHTGTTCTNANARGVLNINFIPRIEKKN